jgi:filamentous hemagglutinin family protein
MTAGRSPFSARGLLLVGGSLLALAGPAAAQGPTGGAVVRGKATISQSADRSVIRQKSKRAIVDWKRFDVGRGHEVIFDQPDARSATLNRVRSADRSLIEGAIRAPGTVVLQNQAGVTFARGARVDAGGMVASSQAVDAEAFARDGGLRIGGGERPGARVVNAGTVTVGARGLAALVGGDV